MQNQGSIILPQQTFSFHSTLTQGGFPKITSNLDARQTTPQIPIPNEKLMLLCHTTHHRKAFNLITQLIHISIAILAKEILPGLLHLRTTQQQLHIQQIFIARGQQCCLVNGPKPQGAPVIHYELQTTICAKREGDSFGADRLSVAWSKHYATCAFRLTKDIDHIRGFIA